VLGLEETKENMEGCSGGDMKSLKLSNEDVLVCSKWRRLRRIVMIVGVMCLIVFLVQAHPGYTGLKCRKTVVVVAGIH